MITYQPTNENLTKAAAGRPSTHAPAGQPMSASMEHQRQTMTESGMREALPADTSLLAEAVSAADQQGSSRYMDGEHLDIARSTGPQPNNKVEFISPENRSVVQPNWLSSSYTRESSPRANTSGTIQTKPAPEPESLMMEKADEQSRIVDQGSGFRLAGNAEPPDDAAHRTIGADQNHNVIQAQTAGHLSSDRSQASHREAGTSEGIRINKNVNALPFKPESVFLKTQHDDGGKTAGRQTGRALTGIFQYSGPSGNVNSVYRQVRSGPDPNAIYLSRTRNTFTAGATMIQRDKDDKIHTAAPPTPALDPSWEQQLLEVMNHPVVEGDQEGADVRVVEFEGILLDAGVDVYAALYARLSPEHPPVKDKLAVTFKHTFSGKTRTRLLKRFKDAGSHYYQDAAPKAGATDLWKELAPGRKTREVQKLGRVDAPKGVYLRSKPFGAKDGPLLPFDTLVMVERETIEKKGEQNWIFVVALGDAGKNGNVTGTGFIESYFVATKPPEPTAHLHLVQPGEMLKDIAARYYKEAFTWGNDARVYVQAIYHANKERDVMFLQKADLTVDHRALDTHYRDTALDLWKEARVVQGQALWMPSFEFVSRLKAAGVINSASISSDLWDATAGAVMALVDWAQYAAGFIIGLLEGAFEALADLFKGIIDLVKALWTLFKAVLGDFDDIIAFAKKLSFLWKNRKDIMDKIATDFMKKWEDPNNYDRGNFQGEVLGYVMMTAFILLVTFGGSAAITGAGRFGNFLKLIEIMDTAGDITFYAGKLFKEAKVPVELANDARKALEGRVAKGIESEAGHAPHAPNVDPHAPHGEPHGHERDSTHGEHSTPRHEKETVTIDGLAQRPRLKWEKNPGGEVRTLQEARELAKKHGVEIPDDVIFNEFAGKYLPDDTFARYFSKRSSDPEGIVHWDDFYNEIDDTLSVTIKGSILESDEAIVAVLGHEMHELNELRRLFDELGGTMSNRKLANLINPGIHGNLHDQAWDVADKLVLAMRKAKGGLP